MVTRADRLLAALCALERIPDPPDLRTPIGTPRGSIPILEGTPDRWARWQQQPIEYAHWRQVERARGTL